VTKAKKKRLDELLLDQGHFADLKTAQGWILAGKIVVDSAVCSKPGVPVREDAEISVRGVVLKYASRGGYKLEGALEKFEVSAAGKVVLDAGASTGGFTDCLLQYGAAKVYAVDVGFGQLRGKLAADPRVVNLEKTNVGNLSRDTFTEPIELCVFDLSYLTITISAPSLAKLFVRPVEMIGLIKPLYEGIDQDKKDHPQELGKALEKIAPALAREGLMIRDLMISPILGTRGSVEFLAHLVAGSDAEIGVALARKVIEELRVQCASLPGT
jgi:23S rRNA (cytidine1920-2'-O)/16S rRNA (cytidine1409-2'-O)-methyltransferase